MKGSIPDSLQKLVVEHHGGQESWAKILQHAQLPRDFKIYSHKDVDDEIVKQLIDSTAIVLGIPYETAADAFGDFWMNEYAPKHYFAFFNRAASAKEFLLEMDRVHEKITSSIPNAQPPKFEYEEPEPDVLIMRYKSKRGMYPIFVGLVKAVGKYYEEDLEVLRSGENSVRIRFGGDKKEILSADLLAKPLT